MTLSQSILVARTDRLGDVLLSLPVLGAIRAASPGTKIGFLVRRAHAPLLRDHPWIDVLLEWDPSASRKTWTGEMKWEAALVLQTNAKLALGLRLSGIPRIVGPRSKLHSYFLFHSSIRQHRSRAEKHEAEYGLELLSLLGMRHPVRHTPRVVIGSRVREDAKEWLRSKGEKPSVAIHPGMGGSAANWRAHQYVELAERLEVAGHRVLVTVGPGEEGLLAPFRERCRDTVCFEAGNRGIDFLAALFEEMKLVVAPSTGPLHLAVALGIPTVSVYPAKRVEHPQRWGPYDPEGKAPHPVLLLEGDDAPSVDRVYSEVACLLAGIQGIG